MDHPRARITRDGIRIYEDADFAGMRTAGRVAAEILDTLGTLNRDGLGILLVEQKAPQALRLAKRVYVLSLGGIVAELAASEVGSHHDLSRFYLH